MPKHNQPDHSIFDLISPAVLYLLVANVVLYMYRTVDPSVMSEFGLWPLAEDGRNSRFHIWQLLTHGFLHVNSVHLMFNMVALWMFGTPLERLWGTRPFLLFYFVCMFGAAFLQLWVGSQGAYTVGASGAVFGLLMGVGMMYPNRKLIIIFFPVPIAAKYLVVLYGLLELTLGVAIPRSAVAHFAHLGGMLFGLLLILYWRGKFPIKPSRQLMR